MKNKNRISVLAKIAALALSVSCSFAVNTGEQFPDLKGYELEGAVPDLKGKVVLVDFFASWCGPCRQSFPVMEELQAKYKDKGLVILAVNVDRKRIDMERFVKKEGATFPVVRDAASKLISEVKVPTMPTSFLVDRHGKVAAVHTGFHGDETKAKYISEIESLLK